MTSLVVFGAGGRAGRQIMAEARRRSVAATAVVRDPGKHADVAGAVAGDATDAESVAAVARGHDVAIAAVYSAELEPARYAEVTEALLAGLERAGVGRLLVVGLATTLPAGGAAPAGGGGALFESPDFPAEWRPFSQGRADELAVLRRYAGPVDWVVATPPMELVEDEGDSAYQIGNVGNRLTYTALARALLDEAAEARHHRTQITVTGR